MEKQENLKKINTTLAAKLYDKDSRTVRRWCELGHLNATLDPGGNWEIFMLESEYETRMQVLHK